MFSNHKSYKTTYRHFSLYLDINIHQPLPISHVEIVILLQVG